MIGEIAVIAVGLVILGIILYMMTRKPTPVRVAPVKPEPKETLTEFINRMPKGDAPAYRAPASTPAPRKASTPSRSSYPSGGSTTHIDTSASDTLSTLLILDALDNSSNYVEPSVDSYVSPSYSSHTPSSYGSSSSSSSYSSCDDSTSRSSSYSSSDYSSSSSSSYDSGSSSSSSSSSCD